MKWQLSLIIVGIVALAVGFATIDHYHIGVFHDDAMYVILARAIATGQGYRWINLPDSPIASHFPPGYPLVLAALWHLGQDFPANLVVFKTFNALCFVAVAVLTAQLVRDSLKSERWGFALGLLAAGSIPLLVLVTMVLSEPLFLAVALAVLVLGERLLRGDTSPRAAFAIGALIGVAMLIRTHGLVLAIALLAILLWRRRWRDLAGALIGLAALVLPWQIWSALNTSELAAPLAGNYGSYAAWWLRGFHESGVAMILATVERTVADTSGMFAALLSPGRGDVLHAVTIAALIVAVVAGAAALVRRGPMTALFLLGYVAIVLLWPFPPARFFWGIWPLILFLLAAAISAGLDPSSWPRPIRAAVLVAGAWLAFGYAMYEVRAVRGHWWSSISRVASQRIEGAVRWSLTHARTQDVIAADDEGSIFLYTARRTVPVASFTTDHYLTNRTADTEAREGLVPLMARYPVRLVIVGSTKSFEAAQFLAAQADPALAPLEAFPGGAAYTVIKR